MRITTHGDYLVQITRWPVLFPINVFLVREEDGLTLIDTGMSGQAQAVLDQAHAMGLPITRIVLTHSDPDHIGGLDELHVLLPDAEVLMSEMTARILSGELRLDRHGNQSESANPKPLVKTKATGFLRPGDLVGSLQVYAAPGHKPDQIAFLDTRDNSLIAGDAFQTRSGTAVSGTIRWLFPFPGIFTTDKPAALQTARELQQLSPARLAVGHGDTRENPAEEIAQAIIEASNKLERGTTHAA